VLNGIVGAVNRTMRYATYVCQRRVWQAAKRKRAPISAAALRWLFSEKLKGDLAAVWCPAVLEEIEALPRAE
jgi:hypothetical protein